MTIKSIGRKFGPLRVIDAVDSDLELAVEAWEKALSLVVVIVVGKKRNNKKSTAGTRGTELLR